MRNIIVSLFLLCICSVAFAGGPHRHGHYHNRSHNHSHWVAPLILGGVVGAVIANQYNQPQPQVYVQLPPAPYGYRYSQILDASCNCYRWVLVPGF